MCEWVEGFDACPAGLRFGVIVGVWLAVTQGLINVSSLWINDNVPNVLIPVSLLREGDLELGEFHAVRQGQHQGERYWAVRSENGLYSKYPIWTGVLVAPFFAPFAWWEGKLDDLRLWVGVGRLVAYGLAGVFAGLMVNLLRRWVPGSRAVMLVFLGVFGTAVWHHLGSHLTNQTIPLVCISVVLWLSLRERQTAATALGAGVFAGLAVSCRLPVAFVVAAPLGLFLTRDAVRRWIPLVVVGGLIFPILTMLYNARAFGSPWRTGYAYEAGQHFNAPMLEGLAGLLFSPTCGLLVYSPFLLLGLWVAADCLRGRYSPEINHIGRWLILGIVGQILLLSKWYAWNGALSFSCRLLVETVPLFMVLIALGYTRMASRPKAMRFLIASGVFAILLHLAGTIAYNVIGPTNPMKPDWDFTADFIALYVQRFSLADMFQKLLLYLMFFIAVTGLGGYLAWRFLVPHPPETKDVVVVRR